MSAAVFISADVTSAAAGDLIRLHGAEGRHAATVQRLGVGESIDLVDGAGRRARGEIVSVGEAELEVLVADVTTDSDAPMTLVQALAKGGRDEQAIESAVELGVTAVMPWAADRSIVQWRGPKVAKGIVSWQKLCMAAAKQSRRALVPFVNPLVTTRELVELVRSAVTAGERVLVLHEQSSTPLASLTWEDPLQPVWLIVGPEGGVSEAELEAFAAVGAEAVLLGPHVLRASSAGPAAIAAICALRRNWG